MEYERLKENLQILDAHNHGQGKVINLTGGQKTESILLHEVISDCREILNKIEQKKLRELPCDVGDTVYMVYSTEVKEWEVTSIEIYADDILLRLGNKGTDDYNAVWLKEKGERLFFNPEEAEKRMGEIQEWFLRKG